MNKLKAIAATVLVASAIGVGGLVAAPTASARPTPRCDGLAARAMAYNNFGRLSEAYGYVSLASFYYGQSQAYGDLAIDCYRGLP
jgi:hypothetical protein